ncbi:MAG: allantoinase AllB [Myxococcota bacterium]|nr:allantoinase AllB [Myxococcota bacterium]
MVPPDPIALFSERVLTREGLRPACVLVSEGRIEGLVSEPPADRVVTDLGRLILMPGLVDSHVHINEPGRTDWEGYTTATAAAAAGGITTLVDMPLNCIPVTTSLDALEQKLAACDGKLRVDCGFWGGVVPGNTAELRPMAEAGVLGFKAFLVHSGIDDFPEARQEDLDSAMPVLAELGVPLLVHAELDLGGAEPPAGDSPRDYIRYLHSRPRVWEDAAIAWMIDQVRATGCRVHVVHLSSASALPMLRAARAEGLPITVETCPHYLCLQAEEIPEGETAFKCAPPIRNQANREALWAGLAEGVIDFVISDHSPCTPQLKLPDRGDFMEAWGGIASLQLGLSTVWAEAARRGFAPEQVAAWMSVEPARFLGLAGRKGSLEPGADADLVAWDPDESWVLHSAQIHHRHKVTPYLGRDLKGRVRYTWLRGRAVVEEGELLESSPQGRRILRGQE